MGAQYMVRGKGDIAYQTLIALFLIGISILSVFPILYVISVSITPFSEVIKHGGFMIIPRSVTFEAYRQLLTDPASLLPRAFGISAQVTAIGTTLNLVLTVLLAFALSKKGMPARSIMLFFIVFTMLFNGGMIPTYLIVKATGLINTTWSLIIPSAVAAFNVLLMKSFFENLPEELFESAHMDGASEWTQLIRIALPLSMPVMATVGLFYLVGHWNEFFHAILYISNPELHPIQVVVRKMLLSMQDVDSQANAVPATTMRMAAVVLVSIPVIVVYPFLQKYFTQGMMLGAIKG
jgi:putative aldouronate transport system permease protein